MKPTGAYYWKREPGWTNLRGMWGKRATPLEEALNNDHGKSDG